MSLKRGIFYTFLSQGPALLLYFVSSTLMTRVLGDEGRGAYALLQNQAYLLMMLMGLNIGFGVTYFVSKENGDPSRMVRVASTILVFNLLLLPVFLAITYTYDGFFTIFFPPQAHHWGYLLYLVIMVLAPQVISWIGAIMLALKKFRTMNRMSILNAALVAASFTALYLLRGHVPKADMLPWVLAVSAGNALAVFIIWILIYVRTVGILPVPIWDWSVLKPVLAFVMVGYLTNLVNLVNYRFDVWVVGSFSGTAQLGLYSVAVGIGQLLFYIPEPFSQVVQPFLYRGVDQALLERFKFISRLNFTSVAVLALGLGLSAPWFMPVLYGHEFRGSAVALAWLLPGIVFVCSFKMFSPLIVQGGFIRFNLYATTISAIVTITLDLLIIPDHGIQGAALASSVAYFTLVAVQCFVMRYRMGIPVSDMFLLQRADLVRIRELAAGRRPPHWH